MKKNFLTLILTSVFALGVYATAEKPASDESKKETCEESVHVYVNGEYKGSYKLEVEGNDCGTTIHWIR
ncbi:hypothetical protein [Capnocytophaga stomatis]|uniref:hypothetical protein n=1 Tax=Capnocytophaga stomatis TaxID=1848904 RepID=UPI001AC0A032|nr:hypothetical protein [Capnocytophaga stomatis]GIM49792.1 hypothetical protein CAPN003_12440 [Capnocytophaga stomatis]